MSLSLKTTRMDNRNLGEELGKVLLKYHGLSARCLHQQLSASNFCWFIPSLVSCGVLCGGNIQQSYGNQFTSPDWLPCAGH